MDYSCGSKSHPLTNIVKVEEKQNKKQKQKNTKTKQKQKTKQNKKKHVEVPGRNWERCEIPMFINFMLTLLLAAKTQFECSCSLAIS